MGDRKRTSELPKEESSRAVIDAINNKNNELDGGDAEGTSEEVMNV